VKGLYKGKGLTDPLASPGGVWLALVGGGLPPRAASAAFEQGHMNPQQNNCRERKAGMKRKNSAF